MIPKLARLLEGPINLLMWLSCFVGFLMMMHVTVDVTGRVLFNHPLVGTIEIVAAYYMVAIAFLPLGYIVGHEGHIVVELFTRGLSPRGKFRLDLFVDIVTCAYISLFAWETAAEATDQTVVGEVWETATGFVAIWPSRWLLPIGCVLMALFLLVRIARTLLRDSRG